MKKYRACFTNEYGENWIFEFDYFMGTGLLKGSDVDWNPYPVIEGRAVGLILNQKELDWLRSCWREAREDSQDLGL